MTCPSANGGTTLDLRYHLWIQLQTSVGASLENPRR